MGSIPYILPWILLLLAAGTACAAKFLPFKSIAGIAVISILSLLMIGVAVYDNLISVEFEEMVAEAEAEAAVIEEWKYMHLDELSLIIAQQQMPEDEDVATLKQFKSYGWLSTNADFQRIKEAAQAFVAKKGERPDAQRAIYLYKGIPQNVDQTIVKLTLRNIGYKIIPPKEDEEPLVTANALYFGKYVELEDVKLTALALIRAGVNLTSIKPFNKQTRGNLRAVKLEFNEFVAKRPAITPSEVVEAKKFK